MSDAIKEFAAKESQECGYKVPEGFTYCRHCGGGGLIGDFGDRDNCPECRGEGDFKMSDEDIATVEAERAKFHGEASTREERGWLLSNGEVASVKELRTRFDVSLVAEVRRTVSMSRWVEVDE